MVDRDLQYLYNDGDSGTSPDNGTFEQCQADANAMGDAVKMDQRAGQCMVTLWNGSPIAVEAPNFVVLEVTRDRSGPER